MTWNCPRKHTEETPGCFECYTYKTQPRYRQRWDDQAANKIGPWLPEGATPPEPQRPSPPQKPGFIRKVVNFKSAYQRWVEAGKPLTPPEELAKRRAACNACEYRDAEKDSCRKCGCPLREVGLLVSLVTDAPGKLAMATERCPDDPCRWPALA